MKLSEFRKETFVYLKRNVHLDFLESTAVKPLEYADEYSALEQNLNLTM